MKTLRRSFILCILLLLGLNCANAAPDPQQMTGLLNRGNSEYQKGNYPLAEQHYRQVLDSGLENGLLYYNLGNACFKQKRLGEAIYFWEKAQRIMPSDHEISENLELANLLLVDRIEKPADPFLLKILLRASRFFTIAQENRILIFLFLAANGLFFTYWKTRNPRLATYAIISCLVLGFVFIIFAGSLTWKVYEQAHNKSGIVIEQKVDVRSGPGTENITVFTIHEGIKVQVHGLSNGWYQISLPNGWSGWLQQNNLRVL
jgi:tetratricopeptide (TPR) repeat protein